MKADFPTHKTQLGVALYEFPVLRRSHCDVYGSACRTGFGITDV